MTYIFTLHISLYNMMCPDSRQETECKDLLCQGGERLSLSFSVDHPIPQLWLTASSVSDKPLCHSLISPSLEGNHLPLWISPALLPHITSSPTSDSRGDTLEMQWEDFAGQFCIEILRYSLRLIFTGSVSYRPDHPLPSHHVFPLRLAASEGCLPQATCLSKSEPWIIIFCCLFSYFV